MKRLNVGAIGLFVFALASVAFRFWRIGDKRLWLVSLAMIGLVILFALAACGISWLLTPRRHREILGQLAVDDRWALSELMLSESGISNGGEHGRKLKICLLPAALIAGFLSAFLYVRFGSVLLAATLPTAVVAVTTLPVMLPAIRQGIRMRRTINEVFSDMESAREEDHERTKTQKE